MILIDQSNLEKRNIFANKTNICIDPEFSVHTLLTMLLNITQQFGASRENEVFLCCDSKPSWRHDWYVDNCKNFPEYDGQTYKGDRIKDEYLPWDKLTSISDEILKILKLYSDFHVLKIPYCEADDIIAVLAKQCSNRKEQCFVISADYDFVQCQTEYVHIWNPLKKEFHPVTNVEDYKKLHIIVAGDDNIKNIKKGIGDAKALKMLPLLEETLATNPEMRDRFFFNKKLIDFEEIPFHITDNILKEFLLCKNKFTYDGIELVSELGRFSLNAVVEKMFQFKLPVSKKETFLNTHYRRISPISDWEDSTLAKFF